MFFPEVLLSLAISFFFAVLLKNVRFRNTPPGPLGLPFVGYMPYLSRRPYLDFQKLAKTYGNIFSLQMGARRVVVLNDFESTKDAFSTDPFMGRPKSVPFEFTKKTFETDAFFGIPWKEQRRFCVNMLKDLGLGRSEMESLMREEIVEMLQQLESKEGEPVEIRKILAPSMSNNITSLVFGKRLKHDDPLRLKMDYWVSEIVKSAVQAGWQLFFPAIDKMLKFLQVGNYKKMADISSEMKGFIRKELDEHQRTLDPNNIRDFIDGYLLEIKKEKNDPTFHRDVLEDMVTMFFVAGSEPSRITLEWLLLTVSTFGDVQRKVQEEIDEVLGRTFPTWVDNIKMPYTVAVIYEVMRWKSIAPLVLRVTLSDTTLHGYDIPKNTYIFPNFFAIHQDAEYWGKDADVFRPERFLEEDGKSLKKMERLVPFSIGKRACPGELMAKMEVFIYFVSILQKFDVKLPEGKTVNFEGVYEATLQPHLQDLIFISRD